MLEAQTDILYIAVTFQMQNADSEYTEKLPLMEPLRADLCRLD